MEEDAIAALDAELKDVESESRVLVMVATRSELANEDEDEALLDANDTETEEGTFDSDSGGATVAVELVTAAEELKTEETELGAPPEPLTTDSEEGEGLASGLERTAEDDVSEVTLEDEIDETPGGIVALEDGVLMSTLDTVTGVEGMPSEWSATLEKLDDTMTGSTPMKGRVMSGIDAGAGAALGASSVGTIAIIHLAFHHLRFTRLRTYND